MLDCQEEEVHIALNGQVTNLQTSTILIVYHYSLKYIVHNVSIKHCVFSQD